MEEKINAVQYGYDANTFTLPAISS